MTLIMEANLWCGVVWCQVWCVQVEANLWCGVVKD